MNLSSHSREKEYPLVSVVTPSYNAMPYIKETIESIRSQDYPAIEHIIMDGKSTDGTQQLLQQYPGLIWISGPDRGQSDALNKGFRLTKGEIIGWLNADDTYQPGAIATAVNNLLEYPEFDLVYGDLQIIDDHNRLGLISHSQPFSFSTYFDTSYIKQPTVFMRRRVIDTLGGVDERLHYVMDREFWLRAGLYFKMLYLPGVVLANFRFAPGSKSFHSATEFHKEWLQVMERTIQDSAYKIIPLEIRKQGLRKAQAGYSGNQFIQAVEARDRRAVIRNLVRAVSDDWRLIGNRGLWGFLADGLLGTSLMKNRKRYGLPQSQPDDTVNKEGVV